MTQSGRNMNHIGQSISLYPVTPKRSLLSESISMVFFLMGNDSTEILLSRYYDSYFDSLCCVLIPLQAGDKL